jgi:hypothetical protein
LTTVLAGILIFCCVFGLKPERTFLFCFTSLPNPGKTNSPFFFDGFVGEVAECIEEYSSVSFAGLGGSSEADLKFVLGHVYTSAELALSAKQADALSPRVPFT